MCFIFNEFKGSMCTGIISYVLFQFNLSIYPVYLHDSDWFHFIKFITHHLVYFQFHNTVLKPFWHRSIPVYCKSNCELISSDNTFIPDSNQCITNGERTNYVNCPTTGMQHTTGCLSLCMTQKTIQSDRSLHCFYSFSIDPTYPITIFYIIVKTLTISIWFTKQKDTLTIHWGMDSEKRFCWNCLNCKCTWIWKLTGWLQLVTGKHHYRHLELD